ncbi:hypothetical protein FRC14_007710 [Serendipita sp. 396]|nr:hypothetical protein FRC14_007710 [Serendipita sp. 396]
MADTEANRNIERTGTLKSLTSILKVNEPHDFVAYLDNQGTRIQLTNNVVPLLSVVVGLILVFRNSTSYDRWAEGRRDFGTMTSAIRNLSRNVWISVNLPEKEEDALKYMRSISAQSQSQHPTSSSTAQHIASARNLWIADHLRNEKIRFMKLLVAFAIATKHHLRNEPGLDYEDYIGLLPPELYRDGSSGWESTTAANPDHSFTYSPTQAKPRPNALRQPTPSTPLLSDSQRTVEFHAYPERQAMPIPLVISHEISRAIYRFMHFGCLSAVGPAMHNGMHQLLQSMVEQLTSMERVNNTPIPARFVLAVLIGNIANKWPVVGLF